MEVPARWDPVARMVRRAALVREARRALLACQAPKGPKALSGSVAVKAKRETEARKVSLVSRAIWDRADRLGHAEPKAAVVRPVLREMMVRWVRPDLPVPSVRKVHVDPLDSLVFGVLR